MLTPPRFDDDDVQYCTHCGRDLFDDIYRFYDGNWFCDVDCMTEYVSEQAIDNSEEIGIASAYTKRKQWEKGYEEYLESTAYDDWKDSRWEDG